MYLCNRKASKAAGSVLSHDADFPIKTYNRCSVGFVFFFLVVCLCFVLIFLEEFICKAKSVFFPPPHFFSPFPPAS